MKQREPSKLEMQVLRLQDFAHRGRPTLREVLEALADGKPRAYTTILSVMQVMEKKGLLQHTSQGNTHVYEARVSQQKIVGPLLRGLVQNLFGGSPATALQHLLKENEVSAEELAEIKKLIASKEKSGVTDSKLRTKGTA